MRAIKLVCITVAIILCAACGNKSAETIPQSFPFYAHPQAQMAKRVIVFPFYQHQKTIETHDTFNFAISQAWRELGHFEVVNLSTADRDSIISTDPLRSGRIVSEDLRKMRQHYQADAVLIGRLEEWQSYDPVAIGLQAYMFDCGEGIPLWTGSGHWDAARADIQKDVQAWHTETIGAGSISINGWRNALQSPRLFSRYVADRLAATVIGEEKSAQRIDVEF